MSEIILLAPGPSASQALADSVRGHRLGVVGNAFQLAPWAEFIAASDRGWWRKHPEASKLECPKYSMTEWPDTVKVSVPYLGQVCNSGVLALEVAKNLGVTRIILLGFDMRGTHFFGQYTNGLRNTTPTQRAQHHRQYEQWAKANRSVEVINCTKGSALTCFPKASLDEGLAKLEVYRSREA